MYKGDQSYEPFVLSYRIDEAVECGRGPRYLIPDRPAKRRRLMKLLVVVVFSL